MSLTSFLKTEEARGLFKEFPNVKNHLVECNGAPSKRVSLTIPRLNGANPAIVGTAYDFCCRAITQRVNGILIEEELSPVLDSGLQVIAAYGLAESIEELEQFRKLISELWKTRIDFIKGKSLSTMQLAIGALRMAQVEQAYRSGRLISNPCTSENVNDLCNLINASLESRLLRTNQKMYMNPSFGYHSLLVGGADADMVFGTTLIDIKTTVYTTNFQEYFEQLFGYYLLSEFDKTFETSLQNLAVYLPRFDALYYLSISVLRGLIDIDAFAKQFLELIEEYDVNGY